MSSTRIVIFESPDRAVLTNSGSMRKRPTSSENVLKELKNYEEPCIASSSSSANISASRISGEKKRSCLCAPTTHAGSFRCRLHRVPPPVKPSSQSTSLRSSASSPSLSSLPLKLLKGEKKVKRASIFVGNPSDHKKPSRLSKMVTCVQLDSKPMHRSISTEDLVSTSHSLPVMDE